MKVYESRFKEDYYFEEAQILEEKWFPSTEDMSEEEFREEMHSLVKLLFEYQPKGILVDSQKLYFPLVPDTQQWMVEHIFCHYPKIGMRHKAFVLSEELFAQVSLEQHLEEDKEGFFNSSMFEDRESAWAWLTEKRA